MLWLHGREKLHMLLNMEDKGAKFFMIVVSGRVSLGLTVFAEVVCAGLLIVGLFGRFAALALTITMGVALYKVHHLQVTGANSGELALVYLMAFTTLFCTGPGAFSLDGKGPGAASPRKGRGGKE